MDSPGKTVRIKGFSWQSYLIFGQSSTLSVVNDRATIEPIVTKVSGETLTAKKADGIGTMDITTSASSITLVAISYNEFTMSVV